MLNYLKDRMINRFKKFVFGSLGFTATTSILVFPILGLYIKVFNVIFALAIFLLIFDKRKQIIRYTLDNKYLLWMLISLLSSLFGALYFMELEEFQSAALSFVPKIILYTVFYLLLKYSYNSSTLSVSLCNGLLLGCVFNLIWAIVDALLYYSTGISITNNLFASYLTAADIRYNQASLIIGGTIRACGINYDPANIGLFAPIVALYGLKKRSYVIYGLSVVSIFASLSHTAFLGIIVVTLYHLYTSKHRFVALLSFMAVVFAAFIVFSYFKSDATLQMAEAFVERTEQKTEGGEMQGNRGEYWLNFIPAAIHQPSALIIGTGYFTASYPYLKNNLTRHDIEPYDPEQTYFSTYFDIGLIGFIIFIGLLYGLYSRSKIQANFGINHYIIIHAGIVGSAVAFLGYHYTLYSVVMLIIIAGIVLCDKRICNSNLK
jgi:hypothetical protein